MILTGETCDISVTRVLYCVCCHACAVTRVLFCDKEGYAKPSARLAVTRLKGKSENYAIHDNREFVIK